MYTCKNKYVYNDKWHCLKGNERTFWKYDQHWTKRRHIAKKKKIIWFRPYVLSGEEKKNNIPRENTIRGYA